MAINPARNVEKPFIGINAPTIPAVKNNPHQGKKYCAKMVSRTINMSCAINFISLEDLMFAWQVAILCHPH